MIGFDKFVAAALSTAFLAGCAGQSAQESVDKYKTYTVVSIVADYAHFGFTGGFAWSSEWYYQNISSWGLDAEIEARLRTALARTTGKPFLQASYDRAGLLKAYPAADVEAPMTVRPQFVKPDLELIKSELIAIAAKSKADALILVVKDTCHPFFAKTYQGLYANGFGVWARVDFKNEVADSRVRFAYLCSAVVVIDGATGKPMAQRDVKGPGGIPAMKLDNEFRYRPKEVPPEDFDRLRAQFQRFVDPVAQSAADMIANPK